MIESKIIEAAVRVRIWAERYQRNPLIQSKYDFDTDLGCMCAYASTVLFEYLCHVGIPSYIGVAIHHNDGHVFLKVQDRVLDVTATQFNNAVFKPVEFCLLELLKEKDPRSWVRSNWNSHRTAWSVEELFSQISPQSSNGFPDSQYWTTMAQLKRTIKRAITNCDRIDYRTVHEFISKHQIAVPCGSIQKEVVC